MGEPYSPEEVPFFYITPCVFNCFGCQQKWAISKMAGWWEATQHQPAQWDDERVVQKEDGRQEAMRQPAGTMRRHEDKRTMQWQATQHLAWGEISRKKGRRCDEMMRCSNRGVIFERRAKVRCDVWQAQCWTVNEKILANIRLLNWQWVHLKVDNTGVMNNKQKA